MTHHSATHHLIPEKELSFSFSCSSSPGGQNVNKVATKVTLRFDVRNSPSLNENQKEMIEKKLVSRIDKKGVLRVIASHFRTQGLNRKAAVEKLEQLLRDALHRPKNRKKTKPPKSAARKRLTSKKRRSVIKKKRSQAISWDE